MTFGKWLLTFCAWVVGAAVGIASLTLLTTVLRWIAEGHEAEQVIVAEAISFAFPIAGALLLARWVQSPAFSSLALRISSRRLRASAVALLIALYLATWAFGVPAVTTHLVRRDIEAYKQSYTGKDPDWWKQFPYVRSAFGIPILPGLVVVYYESQLGGLWGAGSWYIFAWWGVGQHELSSSWRWIS